MKTFTDYLEAVHQAPERMEKYVISCVCHDAAGIPQVKHKLDEYKAEVLRYEVTDHYGSGRLKEYSIGDGRFFVYIIKCPRSILYNLFNAITTVPEMDYTLIFDYYNGEQLIPEPKGKVSQLFFDMGQFAEDVMIRYKLKMKPETYKKIKDLARKNNENI